MAARHISPIRKLVAKDEAPNASLMTTAPTPIKLDMTVATLNNRRKRALPVSSEAGHPGLHQSA